MATEYHLTAQGPRLCRVDKSNPRSRGCPVSGTHFDNYSDAMEAYTEDLQSTFGDFHVLVRPSLVERTRRAGYRTLETIDKVKASDAVTKTVAKLKETKQKLQSAGSSKPLSSSVHTKAYTPALDEESQQALSHSREAFTAAPTTELPLQQSTATVPAGETVAQLAARMQARASLSSFKMKPVNREQLDRALAAIQKREQLTLNPRDARNAKLRKLTHAKAQKIQTVKTRLRQLTAVGRKNTQRSLAKAGFAVKASASIARDVTMLKARKGKVRLKGLQQNLQKRAQQMNVPASNIRAGDTFDGTVVRAVELVPGGRMKVSYQASAQGPLLSTTLDKDRVMRVDRKTRREARNSRIASRVARPVHRTQQLATRTRTRVTQELEHYKTMKALDPRFRAVQRSIAAEAYRNTERERVFSLTNRRKQLATVGN